MTGHGCCKTEGVLERAVFVLIPLERIHTAICSDRCSKCCWQSVYTYSLPVAVVVMGVSQHRLATFESDTAVASIQLRTSLHRRPRNCYLFTMSLCLFGKILLAILFQVLQLHKNIIHSHARYEIRTRFVVFWYHPFSVIQVFHDDVIQWKHFPRYWLSVGGIHRSPANSPHKGQWRGAMMFSLICVWINSWVNNREAGDFRRYRAHYDVTVMRSG